MKTKSTISAKIFYGKTFYKTFLYKLITVFLTASQQISEKQLYEKR